MPDESRITVLAGTKAATHRERLITDLAAKQHGVLSTAQLRAIGLGDSGLRKRCAVGRLRRLHRGVYAVRGPLSERGRMLGAVLACGERAVLSHRSAGHLLGPVRAAPAVHHVTSPSGTGRGRPGLRAHTAALDPVDITSVDGIPVTALPRTLLDIAATSPNIDQLRRAIDRAETLRIFDLAAVIDLLRRTSNHRGHARLTVALGHGPIATINELEAAMQQICADHGLPEPLVNHWIPFADGGGVRPDFLWPDRALAVETDGFATHGTRRGFGADRARDRRLKIETGIDTYRFTHHEVMVESIIVGRELRALLTDESRITVVTGTKAATRRHVGPR